LLRKQQKESTRYHRKRISSVIPHSP
jgi:hypothetical protein